MSNFPVRLFCFFFHLFSMISTRLVLHSARPFFVFASRSSPTRPYSWLAFFVHHFPIATIFNWFSFSCHWNLVNKICNCLVRVARSWTPTLLLFLQTKFIIRKSDNLIEHRQTAIANQYQSSFCPRSYLDQLFSWVAWTSVQKLSSNVVICFYLGADDCVLPPQLVAKFQYFSICLLSSTPRNKSKPKLVSSSIDRDTTDLWPPSLTIK